MSPTWIDYEIESERIDESLEKQKRRVVKMGQIVIEINEMQVKRIYAELNLHKSIKLKAKVRRAIINSVQSVDREMALRQIWNDLCLLAKDKITKQDNPYVTYCEYCGDYTPLTEEHKRKFCSLTCQKKDINYMLNEEMIRTKTDLYFNKTGAD